MPSMYIHRKFGEKMLQCFPETPAKAAREHRDAFELGLYGTPDHRSVRELKEPQNAVQLAYLLGLICHESLEQSWMQSGISFGEDQDFTRYYMEQDKVHPLFFRCRTALHTDQVLLHAATALYGNLTVRQLRRHLKKSESKKGVKVRTLFALAGNYAELQHALLSQKVRLFAADSGERLEAQLLSAQHGCLEYFLPGVLL